MKKVKKICFFTLVIGVMSIMFSSCETGTFCASCYESNSQYYAEEYCGTSSSVDSYIDELESYDPNYPNQSWSCTKIAQ